MVGRVILLIAAFVVAGLGALLVFLYAQQSDDRAIAELEPVKVLVVEQEVPAGTSLAAAVEAGSFVELDRPAASVPEGYITDPEEAVTAGAVVLTTLFRGEVLIERKVGDPADLERLQIEDGDIAASFTLEDPNRVADFLTPGSRVAVFLTQEAEETETIDPVTGESTFSTGGQTTRLLLPDVQVIAIGGTTTQTTTTTDEAGQQQTTETNLSLLTLTLGQREAEQMILGQSLGTLYLGLLTDASAIAPDGGTTAENLFEAAP